MEGVGRIQLDKGVSWGEVRRLIDGVEKITLLEELDGDGDYKMDPQPDGRGRKRGPETMPITFTNKRMKYTRRSRESTVLGRTICPPGRTKLQWRKPIKKRPPDPGKRRGWSLWS